MSEFNDAVTAALSDIVEIARSYDFEWALVGGLALQSYGVPRHTLDVDAFVAEDNILQFADALILDAGWLPLVYSVDSGDYVETSEAILHYMDDPVLFDVGQQRVMIPLSTKDGLPVELIAAQHPVEVEMMERSVIRRHYGIRIPIAPLGGILLVKTKADRLKDKAAIEQVAEHLSGSTLQSAIAWAEERDPATAEDLRSIISVARIRRNPVSIKKRSSS